MTNIPKDAWPIVEVIRRDVKRPKALPKANSLGGSLRWWRSPRKRWVNRTWQPRALKATSRRRVFCCPMGLHKLSRYPTPCDIKEFPIEGITYSDIRSFFEWWDGEWDAEAVMKALYEDKLV